MKRLILLILFSTSSLFAASRPHLKCLGSEEVVIHKRKIGGAFYKLNQEMISALLQLSETAVLKKKFLNKACTSKHASLEILEAILSERKPVFYSNTEEGDIKQKSIDDLSIKQLKISSFEVFINFLTRLQAGFEDPKCLRKNIPEVISFYENAQHLMGEVGVEKTIKAMVNKKKVFASLRSLSEQNNCK